MSAAASFIDPAYLLLGLTLPNTQWKITQQIPPGITGSTFGVSYLAERDGTNGKETAFVKAIDFVAAFNEPDPLSAFGDLVNLARYESEIADFCTKNGMTKVVRSFGKDQIIPPQFNGDQMRQVFCIIFERGEGDLRKKLTTVSAPSVSWKLAVLRDVAQAVSQMHKHDVAHQDIKPSNVITLPDVDGSPNSKLGDVGRAVRKSGGPYNSLPWPGAKAYAPVERYYGYRPSDWKDEREASDAFMVGGLALFLFTGVPLLAALIDRLPDNLKPGQWANGYDSTIKAALTKSQTEVVETLLRPTLPAFADEICNIVYQLSSPSPEKRGDRRARASGQVGMDRIWSRLRLLAQKAKIQKV
ncbi:lipopolysaccharide kinase InaA family protein [Solimonas sp. SE-A11]|uniref:lipopolysaccharide kinase InaA family protein n=1 Tax=Solimonas sp. SE-A11 TaxID=3054954 RepID=UPI00259D050E|nr:serine/threonine-protein kinase [Solimonas sp. SE-A11]MDM4772867.1 serine/threonine-protein kinase [Solimonas sp. SE-A11]